MRLDYTSKAAAQLRQCPRSDARRLHEAAGLVADRHPERMPFASELVGRPGVWRLRKGDYRALYVITADAILVTDVGHRKDIYA